MPEISGVEMALLTKEINDSLRGAYVNNVYSLNETQIIRFRKGDAEVAVLVSPRLGAWVSGKIDERAETSEFTSRVRSEILRAKLEGVDQYGMDRVMKLSFRRGETIRSLIVELVPPGNLIVADEGSRVLALLRGVKSPWRRLAVGSKYYPPEQKRQSPDQATPEEIGTFLGREATVGRALGKNLGLPRKYIDEILSRLSLTQDSPASAVSNALSVVEKLREVLDELRNHPRPCVCSTEFGTEIFAIHPASLPVLREASTLSELMDELYLPEMTRTRDEDDKQGGRVRELSATLENLRAEVETSRDRARKLRALAGELGEKRSIEEIGKSLNASKGVLPISFMSAVKPESSAASLSSSVYRLAKDEEHRIDEIEAAVDSVERKIRKERGRKSPETKRQLRVSKKEWFERYRWFLTSEGKLAVGGRDAQSNSILIKRHMNGSDAVYHADIFGSPFFLLKGGSSQNEKEVLQVAQATACFSSAWKTGLSSADAYWVAPEQVSASAPSGEYLSRGSFMIRGEKKFVRNNLLEVAVGVDGAGRLAVGPESAISTQVRAYLVLKPHREKPSETAKKVFKELQLGRLSGGRMTIDDVLRALPTGGGKIVRRRGLTESPVGTA